MSDKSLERAGSVYWLVGPTASRTTPLHSVALRVTNASTKILLLEPIIPIDNPHRGSGDLLGCMVITQTFVRIKCNVTPLNVT